MTRRPLFPASRSRHSGRNNVVFGLVCIAGLVGLGLCTEARAQEVSANVAVTSDYVFRGVSQTGEDPAIQAGLDLTHGQFYAGAWASNVDFGDGETDAEVDLYLGVRPEFAGLNWDFGVVGYLYTGQPDAAGYDYAELKVAASRAVGPATLVAAVFWSPNFFGAEDEATYAEFNGAFSPADRWTLSGAVGRQWVSSGSDYNTWNAGVAYQLTRTLAVDVRYHDTDEHAFGDSYGSRAVASLKAVF
ncbi:MAG TPA: hypothetical protein DGP25_10535 [Brevundimonas sp.]|nr:hypothetical protein [Brevundimonas sp.]